MRVLITGAFGRLGQTCIVEALRQGYEVNAFDIFSKANQQVAMKFIRAHAIDERYVHIYWGDIRRIEDIQAALKGVDAVIHYAAVLPPVTDDAPALAEDINVNGTINVISAVQSTDRKIAILYPSSLTVFGNKQQLPPPRHLGESTQASDNYTDHKLKCERALVASGLPFVIFRVGVSVGTELQGVDPKTLSVMLGVKPDNRLEYVHPNDVAKAMVNAVNNEQANGEIFLIGGGKDCQIYQRDLINATLGAAGLIFSDSELGNNDYYTDWLDTEKSQAVLQYQTVSFSAFRLQMHRKLRLIRPLVAILAPLIKRVLKYKLAAYAR